MAILTIVHMIFVNIVVCGGIMCIMCFGKHALITGMGNIDYSGEEGKLVKVRKLNCKIMFPFNMRNIKAMIILQLRT